MRILSWINEPWPWYVAGPLIGMMVPLLLFLGNKTFGISSSLRHICAAMVPSRIKFFNYDWKKEVWNLVFVGGVIIGAGLAVLFLSNHEPISLNPKLATALAADGIHHYERLAPVDLFNWNQLLTARGMIIIVGGGFLIGFGTRYAGGCTSGHSIMGLSNLQWPSLVATICFMAGGFMMSNLILPAILKL